LVEIQQALSSSHVSTIDRPSELSTATLVGLDRRRVACLAHVRAVHGAGTGPLAAAARSVRLGLCSSSGTGPGVSEGAGISSGSTAMARKPPGRVAAPSRAFTARLAQRAHELAHLADPAPPSSGGPDLAVVGVGHHIRPAFFHWPGNEA
jgi:hypothetical protein